MPLHTDDVTRDGNLDDAEYARVFRERAETIGGDGLHVVPQEYLDAIEAEEGS